MRWLQRGRQKKAVAQVWRKPLTESELWARAKTLAPRIQLRDVWAIVRQALERQLAVCLNPQAVTGKIFFWNEVGCEVLAGAFGLEVPPLSPEIDWNAYSQVIRAKVRKLVLLEIVHPGIGRPMERTAVAIRKALRERHPLGLNPTLRALKELATQGLITFEVVDGHKVYRPTGAGEHIAQEIER